MRGFVHWRFSLKPREAGIAVQFSRQVRQRNFTATSFCFVCFARRARKRMHSDYVGLRSSKALSNVCCRRLRGVAAHGRSRKLANVCFSNMGLTEATRAPIPRRTSTRYCLVLSTRSYVRSTTFFSPGRSPFLVSSSVIDARAKSICGQRSDMISPFRIPVASATITMG